MHPDLSSCGKYPWSIYLLMIFDNMGDISLMLSFKTEFEILLRPAPLSFNSFITFSISVALVGKIQMSYYSDFSETIRDWWESWVID